MSGSKQFTRVSNAHPSKNLFDLSHSLKADHDFGYIYPVLVKQCVPGDVIRLGIKNVTRMNPSVVPFSHQVDVNYYAFFVPYRILDFSQIPNLFESVISGGLDGEESRDFPRLQFATDAGSGYSAYGYIRNIYSLHSWLTSVTHTYFPSTSSSTSTTIAVYPETPTTTSAYLEPSYVYPNPQGITDLSEESNYNLHFKLAYGLNSLSDYLGIIPPQAFGFESADSDYTANSSGIESKVLAYPWYAYNRIYIDYFADENIESKIFCNPSGVQDNGDFFIHNVMILQRCNWEKDYFSSALPWQQRGTAPAIDVSSVVSWANLTGLNSSSSFDANGTLVEDLPTSAESGTFGAFAFKNNVNGTGYAALYDNSVSAGEVNVSTSYASSGTSYYPLGVNLDGLSGSFDIAQLRNALSIQHFMERNARSGVRYTEFLRSHFGVSPSDGRLQRAEYLGGTKTNLIVSEVMQTSETTSTGGTSGTLGDYAGKGLIAMEDGRVVNNYHVDEFGLIMVVMTIRPKPAYYQGVPREWLYGDRYSWFFPEFQNLSEQAIMNEELYLDASMSETDAEGIFGYQGIYDELRTAQDRIAGELRDTLDYWHLARKFSDIPSLSYDFIKVMPYSDDLHRVFAYEGTAESPVNPFVMTHVFNFSMLRPITFMPNPGVSYV